MLHKDKVDSVPKCHMMEMYMGPRANLDMVDKEKIPALAKNESPSLQLVPSFC